MKDKRCRQTGCPFAAGWNMLRRSLNNKPIRWKILLINVAIFLLMAVFSCVLVYHTMFLPNERLYQSGVFDTCGYECKYGKRPINKDFRGVSPSQKSLFQ